jgi:hypothetical protein
MWGAGSFALVHPKSSIVGYGMGNGDPPFWDKINTIISHLTLGGRKPYKELMKNL